MGVGGGGGSSPPTYALSQPPLGVYSNVVNEEVSVFIIFFKNDSYKISECCPSRYDHRI